MSWYVIGLVLGLIAPWVILGPTLRIAFARGMTEGLGAWFGIALFTVPVTFAVMWIAGLGLS